MHQITTTSIVISLKHVNWGLVDFVLTLDQGGVRRIPHIHTLVTVVLAMATGLPFFLV
jgi:hypothetical protein